MYGGYDRTPQNTRDRLQYMLIYSVDGTASSMFTTSAIPTIAAGVQARLDQQCHRPVSRTRQRADRYPLS